MPPCDTEARGLSRIGANTLRMTTVFTQADVVRLYSELTRAGVTLWVDGGWCVAALTGGPQRHHSDMDIAIELSDHAKLQAELSRLGFLHASREGSTEFCYVMRDRGGRKIDIHVVEYDANGAVLRGIAYPHGSLAGMGELAGVAVRCVTPEAIYQFKTAFPPRPKDRQDVSRLAATFGFDIPRSHRG